MAGWTIPQREWATARYYATLLRQGLPLPEVETPGLSLALGERAVFRAPVTLERDQDPAAPAPRAVWVVGTTQRLVIEHASHGGESFWISELLGFDTALTSPDWALDLTWPAGLRLRLSGPSAPLLAVHVAAIAHPDTWLQDPRLELLAR